MAMNQEDIDAIAQAMQALGGAGAAGNVQAVALKLPDFWANKPDVKTTIGFGEKLN